MGKSMGKLTEPQAALVRKLVKYLEAHGQKMTFEEFLGSLSDEVLLEIGRRVASTDFAVRFYNNPKHPKFHQNSRELVRAVRRAWAVGAFDHREQILDAIKPILLEAVWFPTPCAPCEEEG